MPTTAIPAAPILAPEEAVRAPPAATVPALGSRLLLAVLLLVLLILGPPVFEHCGTSLWLTAIGANVNWTRGEDDWTFGGSTTVSFPITFRANGEFKDSDVATLRHLHRLESLDLANAFDVGELGLAHLKQLPALKVLDLTRVDGPVGNVNAPAPKLFDKALRHVQPLTGLRELYLNGNPITDEGLAYLSGLTNLEILDLEGSSVTDAGLQHLKSLKNLKTLRLAKTKVTPNGAMELNQAVPDLVIHFKKEFEDE